jgi:foldase protein PrsA
MKNLTQKVMTLAAAMTCTVTLTGCTDASAKISDSKTVLFTIGDTDVTKGDAYSVMMTMSGTTTCINDATNTIAKAEVEVTDEITEQAQSTLDTYKSMYGDSFTSYLDQAGMSEDDYLNDYLIPSLLASELTNKYIEENFDNLCAMYKPFKATILAFSSEDDLNAAKSEIESGTDPATAASNHNSSSSGTSTLYTNESTDLDSYVRTAISALSPDDGWVEVKSSDGSTFNLVKVDSNDPEEFKDEAIDALAEITDVSDAATSYYFKKHEFHVYDITLYNGINAYDPNYLVQDQEESEETSSASTASSTASAAASN